MDNLYWTISNIPCNSDSLHMVLGRALGEAALVVEALYVYVHAYNEAESCKGSGVDGWRGRELKADSWLQMSPLNALHLGLWFFLCFLEGVTNI